MKTCYEVRILMDIKKKPCEKSDWFSVVEVIITGGVLSLSLICFMLISRKVNVWASYNVKHVLWVVTRLG